MFLYIGTYTTKGSKGIYRGSFDARSGALTEPVLAGEIENPSCLAIHPSKRFLYAVNELSQFGNAPVGAVTGFSLDPSSGQLTRLNQKPTGGADPCHLVTDCSGRHLLVANYSGGSVEVFELAPDGLIGGSVSFIQHRGSGPHRRQKGPHAHGVYLSTDNKLAYVTDLGFDAIIIYRYEEKTGKLDPCEVGRISVKPGAGPRRLAFHPGGRFVYLLNELDSTINAFTLDGRTGFLREIQALPGLPENFKGNNTAAEIEAHRSGKFLYVSHRGYHGLGVFAIDGKTGFLTPVQHVPGQGQEPRHFVLDPSGNWLVVANQNTSNVAIFHVDANTGELEPHGSPVAVPTPTWIQWLQT